MIAIYINFETPISEITAAKLEKIGGYEVGMPPDGTCWKLCEYSTDGEPCDFTEEECIEMAMEAAIMLNNAGIPHTIDKD
jgi:hypothetical protein